MLKRRIFSFGTMVSLLPFQVLSLAMLINFCLYIAVAARNVSFTPHEIDTNLTALTQSAPRIWTRTATWMWSGGPLWRQGQLVGKCTQCPEHGSHLSAFVALIR